MGPDVYRIAKAYPAVLAVLGTPEPSLFPFGKAPQNQGRPYAVFQTVYGNPDNKLACPPSEDLWGVQFDAYAKTVSDARAAASALRDAFESSGNYIVGWNGEDWEQATGLWRFSFTAEFWTERSS